MACWDTRHSVSCFGRACRRRCRWRRSRASWRGSAAAGPKVLVLLQLQLQQRKPLRIWTLLAKRVGTSCTEALR